MLLKTVVLEKTLESPLDYMKIKPVNPKVNQTWIFIRKTCWNWNSNTLATWCKEWTHWKKTVVLGKIEGRKRRGWQRIRWLDIITNSVHMSLSILQETVKDEEAWHTAIQGSQRVGHDWVTEQQKFKIGEEWGEGVKKFTFFILRANEFLELIKV